MTQTGSPSNASRRIVAFLTAPAVSPLIALLIAGLVFSLQSDRFLTGRNISLIVQQVMVVGTLAIGQTLIILTAGIDLSNGLISALGGVVMTKIAVTNGVDPVLAIFVGILVCTLFGAVNGLLITRLNLPPFIVTLGTLNIAFALVRIYSTQTITGLPATQTALGETFSLSGTAISYGSVLVFLLYLLTWYVLQNTAFGRHIYAVGNDPEAARLTGIPVNRVLLTVYTIAGATYGVGALMLIARTRVGDPQAGQDANLESITAVVLGGTSLFGGRGTVIGTFVGALLIGTINNGLIIMGLDVSEQYMVAGAIIILAVAFGKRPVR